MKKAKSIISSLLAVALLVTVMPASVIAEEHSDNINGVTYVDAVEITSSRLDDFWKDKEAIEESPLYGDEELVTVIVELEDAPVLEEYNANEYVAEDTTVGEGVSEFLATDDAKNVSEELLVNQENVIADIVDAVDENPDYNAEVEVNSQWTIATNAFSIQVPYGMVREISKMKKVKRAYVEHVYNLPDPVENSVIEDGKALHSYSYDMIDADAAWSAGYTGKGMLVAVLDSGIDIKSNYEGIVVRTHEAFTDDSFLSGNPTDEDNGWNLRYTNDSLKAFLEENQLVSTTGQNGNKITYDNNALYKTLKVPYAADYADGDINVLPADSDHGTHVSGTIAGFAKTEEGEIKFSGVAPDAQILFMKVFSNEGGGATESSIVNALEDSLSLGADVINLSLGSDNGYAIDDTIQNDTYARIESAGIVMMTSAGNSDTSSTSNNYGGANLTKDPEISMMSAPAIYDSNLAVASIDNAIDVVSYMTWTDAEGVVHEVPFADPWSVAMKSDFSNGDYSVIPVGGTGSWSDYNAAGFDNGYNGGKTGIALVKRGEISFSDKINNALSFSGTNHRGEKYGILAVIVYDSDETSTEIINMSVDYTSIDSCFISGKDGKEIADAVAAGYDVKIRVSKNDRVIENATYGELSVYSSWGAGSGLELKPEITAPGGNVWSAVIDTASKDEDTYTGNYELMSGTSMAAPHMTGVAALIRQYVLSSGKFHVEAEDMGDLISQLLVSTAVPQKDKNEVYYSPRQQGAGLVNVDAAINTPAYITVDGKHVGKLELLDDPDKTGSYDIKFTVNNISSEEITYNATATLLRPAVASVSSDWGSRDVIALNEEEIKTVVLGEVTVPANGSVTVEKTLTLTSEEKDTLDSLFENGIYVEGFVSLSSETNPTIGLPMLAFYGDWTKAPIFDNGNWFDEPEDGESVFKNENTWMPSLMGSALINAMGIVGYVNLGENPFGTADNQLIYKKENITLSPNGDGYLDLIDDYNLYQLRNARLAIVEVKDSETGELYFRDWVSYPFKTIYYSAYGAVIPYSSLGYGVFPAWDGTDLDGNALPSGTTCDFSIYAYGEGNYGEEVYNEEVGHYVTDFESFIPGEKEPTFNGHEMDMTGDVISFPVTIDTVAPKIVNNAVAFYEEDGHIYMEGKVYDEDGSLASVEIVPYVYRTYKSEYADPNYKELGMDRNNPFFSETIYDAATKELSFKADVTEYAHTNESYSGENYTYNFEWTGNVVLACGDYGANDRTYVIKVNAENGLVLSQTSALLHVGSSFELSVNNNTGSDAPISRISSNPEVATIDAYGKVVAVAPGQTVITVSNGTDMAHCVIAVEDYNTEVKDFDLSIENFDGLKPEGEAVIKVTNLEPADAVIDEVIWSVEESDEYAENYGEGLITVGKQSEDGLSGFVYLNVATSQELLPGSVGTLSVTLNGVTRSIDIGWDDVYTSSEQDDLVSALGFSSQIVYVKQGETAQLEAKYRQASAHSVGDVITELTGLCYDGAEFFPINGSYEATLVNEEGYELPESIHVYTVYSPEYEYEMTANSYYGYYYDSTTGKITINSAPSGSTNKLRIVADGVVSEGNPAGELSGEIYTKPDALFGPFKWTKTSKKPALTGKLKTEKVTDYYGDEYEVAKYTPSHPGVSYITATSMDGQYSVNFAVVCEPVKATKLTVDTHFMDLMIGDTETINASLTPIASLAKDMKVNFKSFNERVAAIDENGELVAKSEGYAYIKVSSEADNTVSSYCIVKVTCPNHHLTEEIATADYLKVAPTCVTKATYYKSCPTCGGIGDETFETVYGSHDLYNEIDDADKTITKCHYCDYVETVIKKYYVSFNANGGTGTMAKVTYDRAKSYALPTALFKKTGFTFIGWNSKKDGTGTNYANKAAVKNLAAAGKTATLYAQWANSTYTITFNANGGKGTMKTQSVKYGSSSTLLKNAYTRKGYAFAGWSTSKAGKVVYKNAASIKNLTTTGKITLYAVWTPIKYTVSYYLNGGKNNANNIISYTVATKTFTLKNPTKAGYTFVGWYSDSKFKTRVTKITQGTTGNIKLYAKWKKK